MGLDTTHDAWSGAYGAFSRWREALALAAGYEVARLVENEDLAGRYGRQTILIDWGHVEPKNYEGDWDQIPCGTLGPDPLILLIAHSDCDGYLEPEHCALLADRLEELIPALDGQDLGSHVPDAGVKTRRFIRGCRAAAAAGERMEFG